MFSIILPVYNGEKYLEECIFSIVNQTYEKFELIIVNDGSTDKSEDIIKLFNDNRIKYYYKKNGGVAAARNFGIHFSKDDVISFIDQDDIWNSNYLTEVKKIMDLGFELTIANGFVYDQIKNVKTKIYEENPIPEFGKTLLKKIITNNFIFSPTQVSVKKCLFENYGCLNEGLSGSGADDWDLWIRLFANNVKPYFVDNSLVIYRRHDNNNCLDRIKMYKSKISALLANRTLIKNVIGWIFFHRRLSENYLFLSYYYLQKRDYKNMIICLFLSLRTNPLVIFNKKLLDNYFIRGVKKCRI